MTRHDRALPEFENPPVIETVLSASFKEVPGLTSARIGQFWERSLAEALPTVQERERYEPPIERFDGGAGTSRTITFNLGAEPPRTWFSSDDGSDLLQLQRDWIAYNWRKVPASPEYRRYHHGRQRFSELFSALAEFVEQESLGKVTPTQCEVTYINHIVAGGGWTDHGELSSVTTLVSERQPSWLPSPEAIAFSAKFVIPDEAGQAVGRLHVEVQPGFRREPPTPLLRLELTARGRPLGDGLDGVLTFHDLGHEWIVEGFTDITTAEMHRVWKRKT